MAISFISNFISSNLSFIQESYETQAIELFGKDLAESLHRKEHSWKNLMKSWSAFFNVCTVMKASKAYFATMPTQIYCNLQSNEGLIFLLNRRTRYDLFVEATLITPFGYFDINCKTTQTMAQFISNLEKEFCIKLLENTYKNKKYSFTLSSYEPASVTSFYSLCGLKQTDEIRECSSSEADVIKICSIIKYYLDLRIQACSNF